MNIKQPFVLFAIILATLLLSHSWTIYAQEEPNENTADSAMIIFEGETNTSEQNESEYTEIKTDVAPITSLERGTQALTYTLYLPLIHKPYPVIASDNFNDSSSGWVNGIDVSIATIGYSGNEYRILNKTTDRIITLTNSDFTFTEFAAEINARTQGSINGGYGFAFAFNDESPSSATQAYLFQIFPNTQTWRYILQDLTSDSGTIQAQGTNSAINTSGSNRLQIELTSTGLVLLANGSELHTTTSPGITSSRLGLINVPSGSANHDARFDDLVVYSR